MTSRRFTVLFNISKRSDYSFMNIVLALRVIDLAFPWKSAYLASDETTLFSRVCKEVTILTRFSFSFKCRVRSGGNEKSGGGSSGSAPAYQSWQERRAEWARKLTASVTLDEYAADLNCDIDSRGMAVTPYFRDAFAWLPAGAKASHGFTDGKIR